MATILSTPKNSGPIPMSKTDTRFATNTAGGGGPFTTGTQTNKTWDQSPSYSSGNPYAFLWQGSSGSFTVSQGLIDCTEGPRAAGGSDASITIDQCYINVIGFNADHADGIQAYAGPAGDSINLTVTNTCLRAYTTTEAISFYGPTAVGSQGLQWADNMRGSVTFNNVLVWGGDRGVAIYCDTGTTLVDFKDVYFVAPPGGWPFFDYSIIPTGGTRTVVRWDNVRAATVVNGLIVPGSLLASP